MAEKVEEKVEVVAAEVAVAEVAEEEAAVEMEQNPFVAMARKVLLAGMGAVALTQEEIEKIVGKLVERGEIAEQDGKKLVREVMERRKKEAKKAEGELDKRVEELLARMNVPTKGDIDALSAKITALTKKVDELKKS
jgi:poly(hydroxyalkanoate) granule-associated protein